MHAPTQDVSRLLTTDGTSEPEAEAAPVTTEEFLLHNQCALGNPSGLSDRPLLLLKYSRTGSTWLAWTGKTLRMSGKPMTWVHEAQKCSESYSADELSTWFAEYYSRTTNGTMNGKEARHKHIIDHTCLPTVGRDPSADLGVLVATLNPHGSHEETPEFTDEQWSDIFDSAVPDLAVGMLVRTNAVKRAISSIAASYQRKICHSKKLHGDEKCIKRLPKTLTLDPAELMNAIRDSERSRAIVTESAAKLASQHGDGRIFCLTYEGMQLDLVGKMKDLGDYLGATIDPESIAKLEEESVSYKRGSDDLRQYIDNYEEIRAMFEKENTCLLDQLEATEPKIFPLCDVYTGDDVEDEQ